MKGDTRCANSTWTIRAADQTGASWEGAQLAVLMDLRDELQKLNRLLGCDRFVGIPSVLAQIARQTKKKKKQRISK